MEFSEFKRRVDELLRAAARANTDVGSKKLMGARQQFLDDMRPVVDEEARRKAKLLEVSQAYVGPKSVCSCGHPGDGAGMSKDYQTSLHEGLFGHGECMVNDCKCQKFQFKSFLPQFEAVVAPWVRPPEVEPSKETDVAIRKGA